MLRLKCVFLLLVCVWLLPSAVHAIKAKPGSIVVKQPDGTCLVIRVHGDESFHYTTTADGYLIRRGKDGFFRYVQRDAGGGLRLSGQRVRDAHVRGADERAFVAKLRPVRGSDFEGLRSLSSRRGPAQILGRSVVTVFP